MGEWDALGRGSEARDARPAGDLTADQIGQIADGLGKALKPM